MEKAEYIQAIKNLIQKYHPDHCLDESLRPLYLEITIRLNQKLAQAKSVGVQSDSAAAPAPANPVPRPAPAPAAKPQLPGTLTPVKDQSYAYYRQGIRFYQNIHPGQFYRRLTRTKFAPIGYRQQLEILEKIFVSFTTARYFFRYVNDNYPDSPWRGDSEAKIALLDKLWKSYEQRTRRT